jgi:DNA mismatch endonuclease (patch repair protein)
MRANRRRDTKPELAIRSALHRMGLRYRVDFAPLSDRRRRADIVFTRQRVAVYVDGCFWHGCPEHGSTPRTNTTYWLAKIRRNRERDTETDAALREAGWNVVRVWEHDEPLDAALRVAEVVHTRRARGRR